MTLEQVFPGLEGSRAGSIVAVTGNLLDLGGPSHVTQITIIGNHADSIANQIKAADARWHFDAIGPNTRVQGRANRLSDLRWQRAAVFLRVKGDARPVPVETLRLVQSQTDRSYERSRALLARAQPEPRLWDQEALGNYLDARVRTELREPFNRLDIDRAGAAPVRVDHRENISSAGDLQAFECTHRRCGIRRYTYGENYGDTAGPPLLPGRLQACRCSHHSAWTAWRSYNLRPIAPKRSDERRRVQSVLQSQPVNYRVPRAISTISLARWYWTRLRSSARLDTVPTAPSTVGFFS